jgi:DNA repair exonuclease SbcCD ATPase subunit
MQKINGFTINQLTLSGFKGFAEEQTFTFGDTTFITGQNASGKSSIADAIAFAVTGQPFFGDRSCDRLQNPECGVIDVTLFFTDDAGTEHTLNRRRKSGKMSITMDGCAIRQADIHEIFGERDVFLSVFNPLYFIEVLGDEGRTLLEKLTPPVPHEHVLAELTDHDRSLLENEKLLTPQTYLQNRRSEIRELEDTLLYQKGQDDATATQIKAKELHLAEAMQQSDEREITADGSLRGQIHELEQRLRERGASQYQSQYNQAILDMKAELNTLYAGHARFTKLQKEEKCPVCNQPAGDSEHIRAAVSDIVAKGKHLKGQIGEAEQLDGKAKEVFEQFKADDIAKMESEFAILQDRYEKTQKLLDSIDELQAWLADNTVSSEKADAITERVGEKKALVKAAINYIAKRAELSFSGLTMNRVSISLMDVVKTTGEVRDVFKFTYEGRAYLITSNSQSPSVMNRWVLKVNELEGKKRNYESILRRDCENLSSEFDVLRLQAQELTVRANRLKCA